MSNDSVKLIHVLAQVSRVVVAQLKRRNNVVSGLSAVVISLIFYTLHDVPHHNLHLRVKLQRVKLTVIESELVFAFKIRV